MMIKVKTLTGREIEIDIEPTDTIERIKERVEEKEGIPPIQQRQVFLSLCWHTSSTPRSASAASHWVQSKTLVLWAYDFWFPEYQQFGLRNILYDETYSHAFIRRLCMLATYALLHPCDLSYCRLIFAGKQMNDDKMAKEYNIEGGSVLHLVRTFAKWNSGSEDIEVLAAQISPYCLLHTFCMFWFDACQHCQAIQLLSSKSEVAICLYLSSIRCPLRWNRPSAKLPIRWVINRKSENLFPWQKFGHGLAA